VRCTPARQLLLAARARSPPAAARSCPGSGLLLQARALQ
jgi:hypothetical protein